MKTFTVIGSSPSPFGEGWDGHTGAVKFQSVSRTAMIVLLKILIRLASLYRARFLPCLS